MSAAVGSGLDVAPDEEILERLRGLEHDRRRLEADEAALLAQVERRGLAGLHGCKSTVDFLRHLLRIGPRDAAARLALAHAVAPRVTVTGVPVVAQHPRLAAALDAGEISARAVVTIATTVAKLPDSLLDGAGAAVETVLLDFAKQHDPELLARHATDVLQRLDQDGALRDHDLAAARREFGLAVRANGTSTARGEFTAEATEYLRTMLDALAKPQPGPDGTRDPRTAGQRRHDALLEAIKLLLGSGRLPDTGGCTTTLVLTMDADTYATTPGCDHPTDHADHGTSVGGDLSHGRCRTGHGVTIPATVAKRWLDPETRAIL